MVLKRFSFTPVQIGVHLVSLAPFAVAVFDYLTDPSFAGNVQRLEFRSGRLAVVWLLLSLVCSPLYWITSHYEAFKARKTLGRYAFFYALLHVLIFLMIDYAWDFNLILRTLLDTLYMVAGIISFIILLLMAVTSNPQSQAWLKKNWDRLHKLVYPAAALGILHYFLIEKSDIRWPLVAAISFFVLMILRIPSIRQRITRRRQVKKVVIRTRTDKAPKM